MSAIERFRNYVCIHHTHAHVQCTTPLIECCRGLSFPKSVDDLRSLSNQLQLLMEHHYYHIVLLYGMAYLYKQTFAIPGSVFMVSTCKTLLTGVISRLTRDEHDYTDYVHNPWIKGFYKWYRVVTPSCDW